jgi:protein-S-isoprenylcysteine O-methyltransferase Ste14
MSRAEIVEGLAVIGSIALFFPILVGFRPSWYFWTAMGVALVINLVVLWRRWRRMKAALDEAEKAREEQDRQRMPWEL